MKHLFKATQIGWEEKKEGIWFDSDTYSKEEAEAQFKEYEGTTQRGYPYKGYEYDGQKYHDVTYLGEFEDDDLPHNDAELLEKRARKKLLMKIKKALGEIEYGLKKSGVTCISNYCAIAFAYRSKLVH